MIRSTTIFLFLLAIGHGINDFIAGWLLAGAANEVNSFYHFGTYGVIAFGGQVPVALIMERTKKFGYWAIAALVLMAAALLMSRFHLFAAVIFSGIASAIYHVAGGAMSLSASEARGAASGLFAAPGVVGLALGGFVVERSAVHPALLMLMPVAILVFLLLVKPGSTEQNENQKQETHFDAHDGLMLLLLLVVALRSTVWDIFQAAAQGQHTLIILIALAAASGKMLGGILSDRFNQPRFLLFTTGAAVLLLQFAEKHLAFLLAGVALLQSSIPTSVVIIARLLRGATALASGLVLGLGVLLGALLIFVNSQWLFITSSVLLLAVSVIFFLMYRKKFRN